MFLKFFLFLEKVKNITNKYEKASAKPFALLKFIHHTRILLIYKVNINQIRFHFYLFFFFFEIALLFIRGFLITQTIIVIILKL